MRKLSKSLEGEVRGEGDPTQLLSRFYVLLDAILMVEQCTDEESAIDTVRFPNIRCWIP